MDEIDLNANVTIAIPVYERYEFFEDAIKSAISQTIKCKIIIVDNASSHTAFEDYIQGLSGFDIKYYRNDTNIGALGNWNKCIELCETKWLSILHSDDIVSPHYVEVMIRFIKKYPDEIAFCANHEVGSNPNKIYMENSCTSIDFRLRPKSFLLGNHAGFPGNIFNVKRIGDTRFDTSLKGASDYAFWFKLSQIRPLPRIKPVIAFYRISSSQDSASMSVENVVTEPTYWVRAQLIGFSSLFMKTISMYELYVLHCYYQRNYNRKSPAAINFKYEEISTYFNFFNTKLFSLLLSGLFRFTRYIQWRFLTHK